MPHLTTGTAHLPPEIANFMNRVRNLSNDGSDSHGLQSVSGSQVSVTKSTPSIAVDGGDENNGDVGGDVPRTSALTHSSLAARTAIPKLPTHNLALDGVDDPDFHPGFEGAPVQHRQQNLHTQHGSESGSEVATGSLSTTRDTLSDRADGQNGAARFPLQQPTQLPPTSGAPDFVPGARAKAFSLPRGQGPDYRRHYNTQRSDGGSSQSSAPTTPRAQSDLIAPVYPQGSGQERGRYGGEQSSFGVGSQQQWGGRKQPGGGRRGDEDALRMIQEQQLVSYDQDSEIVGGREGGREGRIGRRVGGREG